MRRFLVVMVVAAAAIAGLLLWTAASAWLRSPALVAKVEAGGSPTVSPTDLPRDRLCALLVEQDATFYRHSGVGLFDGSPGHTTVTQAIGKWLLFDHFSPGRFRQRKVRLMVAAMALDSRVSKETQLRLFLNRSYLGELHGEEVIGFPAAARSFFGKELNELTDREFLSILAMLDGPNRFHVLRHPDLNAERAERLDAQVRARCAEGCFQGPEPVPCPPT